MLRPKPEPLGCYRYDPLDRLASCLPLGQADTRSFYHLNKLTTDIQGPIGALWLQTEGQFLALRQQEAGTSKGILIATDALGSVIHALSAGQSLAFGYMPYGTRSPVQAPLHLPSFNGERHDPVTGHYLLGNGYRAFNPVLMRFNSPDSLSPFGKGGLNTYAAFHGAPLNNIDPDGHAPFAVSMTLLKAVSRFKQGLRSMTASRNAALTDPIIRAATRLDRKGYAHEIDLTAILKMKNNKNLAELNIKTVTHKRDIEEISAHSYKFIFTNKSELIIGNYYKNYFPHPVLAYLRSKDAHIISAGHIAYRNNEALLSGYSGHYTPPDSESPITAVIRHIQKLGVNARPIRANEEIRKPWAPKYRF